MVCQYSLELCATSSSLTVIIKVSTARQKLFPMISTFVSAYSLPNPALVVPILSPPDSLFPNFV